MEFFQSSPADSVMRYNPKRTHNEAKTMTEPYEIPMDYPLTLPDPADRYELRMQIVRLARDEKPEKEMVEYNQKCMKYPTLVMVEKVVIDGFFTTLNQVGQAAAKAMEEEPTSTRR